MCQHALADTVVLQGRDRDLLARRLSNAAAASSAAASSTQAAPSLEWRLSRRTSQQLPQWQQQGRSSMQPNAVDLAGQHSGSLDMQPPALPQPRRASKMQSAASGERRGIVQMYWHCQGLLLFLE